MTQPIAYTVFHINMAFSSIEEIDRRTVIERCYWPLLKLAEDGFPIGIEATSYSLRAIQALDPAWISKLKALIFAEKIEFIGSGYTQMIAPLVPPEVTRWNLRLGHEDYEQILGVEPKVALINEQAYAPGLVPLYLEAGYKAVMMDWSEPASHNKAWERSFSYQPQYVMSGDGSIIPMLWSDAMSFQKFQRYAHGEIEADEYFEFLSLQLSRGAKAFPLYTSDAEIFDFRPGRFGAEADLGPKIEYDRIRLLFEAIEKSSDVRLGMPSDALKHLNNDGKAIQLETVSAPVPVKKQRKYNLLRWAVSGRHDISLNTHCWRLYEDLKNNSVASKDDWRNLCGYWASDFRTHITEKRWQGFVEDLPPVVTRVLPVHKAVAKFPREVKIQQDRRFIQIDSGQFHLVLNLYRGLAIQSFGFGDYQGIIAGGPAPNALVGTLAHGFYGDIAYGADFYTGHFIFEPSGSHKVTDLGRVDHALQWLPDCEAVQITCTIGTPWGNIIKTLQFYINQSRLDVSYTGAIPLPLDGSFRLGHVTLNPGAFDVKSLYYAAHNGGEKAEYHQFWGDSGLVESDHGAAVSRLVSATTCLGMTEGMLELGDKKRFVRLLMQRTDAAGVGLVTSKAVDDSFFIRAAISLCEVDETLKRQTLVDRGTISEPMLKYSMELGEHC